MAAAFLIVIPDCVGSADLSRSVRCWRFSLRLALLWRRLEGFLAHFSLGFNAACVRARASSTWCGGSLELPAALPLLLVAGLEACFFYVIA